MAYTRRNTTDGVTIMNKDLYDNLQDGIEERGITPEMFGAVGDGVHDDTEAIKSLLVYTKENKRNIFGSGYYLISTPITFEGFIDCNIEIDRILYTGSDNAIIITNCSRVNFKFISITARNGSCLKYFSDSNKDNPVLYTRLSFNILTAKEKCIFMEIGDDDGYLNENILLGGWLNGGTCGIYADAKKRQEIQFKAYNIGFEGVTTGIYLNGTSSCCFVNPRYAEYTDKVLLQTESARHLLWIGSNKFYSKRCILSSDTSGIVYAPITEDNGGYDSYKAILLNGFIIPQGAQRYKNTLGRDLDLNSISNYLISSYTYFLVLNGTKEIKLNPLYGNKFGITNFICNFSSSIEGNLEIKDSNGKTIFNNIESVKGKLCRFIWFPEVGWVCEVLNTVKTVV